MPIDTASTLSSAIPQVSDANQVTEAAMGPKRLLRRRSSLTAKYTADISKTFRQKALSSRTCRPVGIAEVTPHELDYWFGSALAGAKATTMSTDNGEGQTYERRSERAATRIKRGGRDGNAA